MKYICLVLALCLIAGCATVPHINSVGGIIPTDPHANKETVQLMWPFMAAGFLGLIAGLADLFFLKDWKILIGAVVIALVPPAFVMIIKPLVVYAAILVFLLGLAGVALVFYKVYDYVSEDRKADAEREKKE